jgi:hypothetical protein
MVVLIDHIILISYFKLNMEQSFENENTYDVFLNAVRMENEPLQEVKKMQVSK